MSPQNVNISKIKESFVWGVHVGWRVGISSNMAAPYKTQVLEILKFFNYSKKYTTLD